MPPKTNSQERKKQSAIRAANGALSKLGKKQYGTPEYLRFIAYAISALEKVTDDGPDGLLNPFDDTDKKLIREFKQKLGRLKQEQATLQKEISESKASSAVYGGYQAGGSGGTGQGNLELQRQRAELFAKSSPPTPTTTIPSRYETEAERNRRELLGEHYQTPWQRQQQKSQQQQQLQRQQKKSAPDADVVEIEPGSLGDLDVRRSRGQNERDRLTERRSRSHGSGASGYGATDRDLDGLVRKTESLVGGDGFQKRAPSKAPAKASSSSFSLFNCYCNCLPCCGDPDDTLKP